MIWCDSILWWVVHGSSWNYGWTRVDSLAIPLGIQLLTVEHLLSFSKAVDWNRNWAWWVSGHKIQNVCQSFAWFLSPSVVGSVFPRQQSFNLWRPQVLATAWKMNLQWHSHVTKCLFVNLCSLNGNLLCHK
jgi:hypothetical protein